MNVLSRSGRHKTILAILMLFLVQLACGGVAPTDPRIPESFVNVVGQFDPFLAGLQTIPLGGLRPPLITQILPNSVSGLGSIGSIGSGAVDGTGVVGTQPSYKIRLYQMQLQGCGKDPIQGSLLGETTVDVGGRWTINHNFRPGEVVGATQFSEGKESGLSNLKVNTDQGQFLTLDNSEQLQQFEYDTSTPLRLTGKSFPGACVVLQNQNMTEPRVSETANERDGSWRIETLVKEGQNKFRVFVENWEDIKYELSINGISPYMQWPYAHYLDPITAWYGENDYYKFNNRGSPPGFHDGIDIGGSAKDEVHAVAKGEVFYIQVSSKNGGKVVLIDHGTWFSVYMHLSKITVDCLKSNTNSENCSNSTQNKYYAEPIQVNAGDVIGVTGNTGCEGCGEHLHFSAFRWQKGSREESLGNNREPAWPWRPFGEVLNVNPPSNKILGNGENSSDRLADRRVADQPKEYFSDFDYWLVNWDEIQIKEYECESGTKFDELTWVVNEETRRGAWVCK